MEIGENLTIAITIIVLAICFISYLLFLAWLYTPDEIVFKFEMDNNTSEAIKLITINTTLLNKSSNIPSADVYIYNINESENETQ